jgi:hypothetical protein
MMLNLTCISCNDIPQMSTISVFWQVMVDAMPALYMYSVENYCVFQIPQFALIGVSEILSSITSLEFFYSQVCAPAEVDCMLESIEFFYPGTNDDEICVTSYEFGHYCCWSRPHHPSYLPRQQQSK